VTSYRNELELRLMDRDRHMVTDWPRWERDVLPGLSRVFAGRWSYSAQMQGNHWRKWLDVDDWPYSPPELVREFLRDKIKRQLPRGAGFGHHQLWHGGELKLLDIPAPLHFVGGTVRGEYGYVDLIAAFYTIYRQIGFYDPHVTSSGKILRGWVDLDGVEMFGRDHLARNSLVGIARARRFDELHHGQRVVRYGPGRFTSPGLWGAVVGRLREIARDAVASFGAVYVATDGYIVPAERVAPFADYLGARGLRSRTLGIGEATITGLGSYVVGEYGSLKERAASEATSNLDGDGAPS
jgi:hypothetical protein